MLQKKQSMKNEAWIAALNNIEQTVSYNDLNVLVEKTVSDIARAAGGKRTAFCWSGGKDSLVLARLCSMVGIPAASICWNP